MRCRVDFYVEERREDRRRVHQALDLGAGGVHLLVMDDAYAPDPSVLFELEFTLPTGLCVETKARIVSVDDDANCRGVGLEFVGLDDEMRADIGRYVASAGSSGERFQTRA